MQAVSDSAAALRAKHAIMSFTDSLATHVLRQNHTRTNLDTHTRIVSHVCTNHPDIMPDNLASSRGSRMLLRM